MSDRYDVNLENMPEPENRGKRWEAEDYTKLESLFTSGHSLREIALELGRPASGVLAKLHGSKLVYFDSRSKRYFRFNDETVSNLFGDVRLNDISVELTAFIDGKDLSKFSVGELNNLLEKLEAKYTKLLDFSRKYRENISTIKKYIAIREMK